MPSQPDDLLCLLQCPLTRQKLVPANSELLVRANDMIHRCELTNRLGEVIEDSLDEALIGEAGEWLYAVRDGIVSLLADDAISLKQLDIEQDETNV